MYKDVMSRTNRSSLLVNMTLRLRIVPHRDTTNAGDHRGGCRTCHKISSLHYSSQLISSSSLSERQDAPRGHTVHREIAINAAARSRDERFSGGVPPADLPRNLPGEKHPFQKHSSLPECKLRERPRSAEYNRAGHRRKHDSLGLSSPVQQLEDIVSNPKADD